MSAISALNFETGIAGLPERQASLCGFRSGDRGTHTSRTIMLDELTQLLDAVPGEARRQDYADAVTHDNCLGKRTAATRQLSLQRLTELYGLDGRLLLFRALRNLWVGHSSSRPLLALLLALVRDPLLRATAGAVIATPPGHEFGRQPEIPIAALQDALAPGGGMPGTVVILDEVQQYIGDDTGRSYVVQEIVEACSKRFGDRLLFVGTGQTALSGTPALHRLQGRFTVNVELSDHDVETVIRRVVLAKRPDRVNDVQSSLDASAGEIDRHLAGTRIAPRNEDKSILVDDYPLLPVRRRFWEHTLRAVDRAGMAGQLRTQLRIVYDAIRRTADNQVGTVVAADFLFDEISANLLQSGVLLREIHEAIVKQRADGTHEGALKSRLCALVFLIRKLPREAGIDIGLRANVGTLADLLVENLANDIADRGAARSTLEYKGVPTTPEGIEARQGMETRLTEAENNLRTLVADVVGGARVIQGGGNERPESSLPDKVREAADASLVRLFHKFNDADDHRWPKVIDRARAGADHPLEVLDYSGKTEEYPVCAAVLAFVGAGKRGRDVRSHFSDPPCGWPRDAIDAAIISLFGAGHLRAAANGVALHPPQLDQAKVPRTDFRTESATINARQRLKLRSLFQTAGIECKPNEETVAAGRLLSRLDDLARGAGGDAPLPERPDTRHLLELRSLAGNEQLLAILDCHDVLAANADEWTAAGALVEERLPAFQRLVTLARHADGLDVATEVTPQIEAIVTDRRLLAASDAVPVLVAKLTKALRSALVESEEGHDATYEEERQRLDESDGWRRIEQEARDEILSRLHIAKVSAGATGTEGEVLESLDRISLDDWRTRTAALPQLFAQAKAEADRLVEPKIRHMKLGSATLRTPEEVRIWIEKTERELLEQVRQGPIAIG